MSARQQAEVYSETYFKLHTTQNIIPCCLSEVICHDPCMFSKRLVYKCVCTFTQAHRWQVSLINTVFRFKCCHPLCSYPVRHVPLSAHFCIPTSTTPDCAWHPHICRLLSTRCYLNCSACLGVLNYNRMHWKRSSKDMFKCTRCFGRHMKTQYHSYGRIQIILSKRNLLGFEHPWSEHPESGMWASHDTINRKHYIWWHFAFLTKCFETFYEIFCRLCAQWISGFHQQSNSYTCCYFKTSKVLKSGVLLVWHLTCLGT